MKKPTSEQSAAINSDAKNIAIAASAGSGKTSTMINRIVRLLASGKTTLGQLLVLTFTEESAKDMRKKLKEALGKNLSPVELQAASIGTFHSFCANLVRAWFSIAGVNPSFVVQDELESAKIKAEILEKVVVDHYAQTKAAVDLYAASRTLQGLYGAILRVVDFLETLPENEQQNWLTNVALKCYDPNLEQNPAVQALISAWHQTATWYRQKIIDLHYLTPQVEFVMQIITQIMGAKTYADFHNLHFAALKFPKLVPDANADEAIYDAFHTLRDQFKDDVKKLGEQFAQPVDQLQQDIAADKCVVEQLLFLVTQFTQAYSAKKAELKKLDFADLEKYARKVLQDEAALASIRAQYQYVFVDEAQDINRVQWDIIQILRNEKFFYMVGDGKQSIYGFRGSDRQMFDDMFSKMNLLNNGLADTLYFTTNFTTNFRSGANILQFANNVFANLLPHYEGEKLREFKPDNPGAVKIELAENLDAQMELIYRQIVASKRPYGQIAILGETANHFAALQDYLTARGIPCVIDRATDAATQPEIMVLNNFLFAALNPTNELARFLTYKHLFRCPNDDLAQIRLGQKTVPAWDAKLAEYRTLARGASTYEVLTKVATEFGMVDLPVVDAFLTAIRGVSDFDIVARYLYLLEHDLVKIQINVGGKVPNAVRILTIHHSKGLEFPMVILFDLDSNWTKRDVTRKIWLDRELGLCILAADTNDYIKKSTVLRQGIMQKQAAEQRDEEIRLLYVALTRAKEYLYIVGTWQHNEYKMQENCLLDFINPQFVPVQENVVASPVSDTTAKQTVAPRPTLQRPMTSDTLVKQSVTAIVSQQSEPFQDYVAPVKYPDAGGKAFGTAFHKQVQYGDLPDAVQALVAGYTVYKELPFLYLQDRTMVQGIMDLLAVKGNEAIIVDYKTTRASEKQLVTKYREQLRLYAGALPQYTVRTYLYSTVHQKLIEV